MHADKMRYLTEPRDQVFFTGYGFWSIYVFCP